MMNLLKVLPLLILTAFSCKQVENPKEQFYKWAQKGVVINKVVCKIDANQSYCLYLPTNYDINKTYPVIYAFDPHGNGGIPVALMKNAAEKLGFIIIGSNNSRNGLRSDELNRIVNSLLSDTQQKISVDPRKIYTAGFSGGARVACMVAQSIGGVKGVIACSAGFQADGSPLGFRYIGIAGSQDMNYLEVKQISDYLESSNQPHQLLVFNGKHQWPPESTISEAMDMLRLYAMKDSSALIDQRIVEEYLSSNYCRVNALKENICPDSLALAFAIAKRTCQVLDGLTNVENLKSNLEELSKNPILQQLLNENTLLERYESQKQKEFVAALGSKPEPWWNSEIKQLYDQRKGVKVDVSKRLLGYISLSCYGYVNGALHQKDWNAAAYFTTIYRQVDPENPDCWYAIACLQANTGKPDDAVASLKSAIKFGLSDLSKISSDPLLNSLRGVKVFDGLTKK